MLYEKGDTMTKEKREKQVNFRLSYSEYLDIQEKAGKLGLSVSTYCQTVAINSKVKAPKISPEAGREIASALARYGSNLNQISKRLNTGESVSDAIQKELHGIRRGLGEIWKKLGD